MLPALIHQRDIARLYIRCSHPWPLSTHVGPSVCLSVSPSLHLSSLSIVHFWRPLPSIPDSWEPDKLAPRLFHLPFPSAFHLFPAASPRCPPRHARSGQGLRDCAPRRAPARPRHAGLGVGRAAPHSPCPSRAQRPGAPTRAAAAARAASAPSRGAWRAPSDPQARRPPRPLRDAGWGAWPCSSPRQPAGAGFVGLSRAARPSPLRLLTAAPREGRSGSGPALVPPPPPPTHQAVSLRPGHRAREHSSGRALRGRWARIQGKGFGDDAPEVPGPRRARGEGGREGRRGWEVGSLGVCAGEAAGPGEGSGQRPCPD